MKYYKVKIGYNESDYVSIDDSELELALYIFLTDGKAIFKSGVVRGKDIIAITEDWHKALGVNPKWKLDADDWNEIHKRGIGREYKGSITIAKMRVQFLIESKQEHLIGKGGHIPELEAVENKQLSGEVESLAKKMSV